MKKIVWVLIFIGVLTGCTDTNPYADTYINTSSPNISITDKIPTSADDIKFINSSNVKEDMIMIYEDGYEMVGYSSFNTVDLSNKYLKEQALNVRATLVLYSKKFASQDSELEPVFFDDFCYSRYWGDCGGVDWQYVLRSKYDYLATYWVKTNLTGLGFLVKDISREKRSELETNYGVEISAIRKDSDSYSDIVPGDVIYKVNDIIITNKAEYDKIIIENKGKHVKLQILRKSKSFLKDLLVK